MKDWQSILKTKDEDEYKEYISILPNYRVIATIRNKNCIHGKCAGNHKMILRYMKCTSKKCGECQVQYRTIECSKTGTYFVEKLMNTEHTYKDKNPNPNPNTQPLQVPQFIQNFI